MRLKVYAMDSSKVEGIIRDYSLRGYYPTAVCRVFNARETLCRFAVGDATPDSWFDLASVSKIVCATMIFFLMDEGRLAPEDPVLPYLDGTGEVTRRRLAGVTLRHLLTHTSGIVPWYPFYADGRPFFTVLEHVLSTTPAEEGMAYSDLNFMLLGVIFSRVSGLSLREGLERYIRQGLGIKEMAYGPVDASLCVPSCFGNQIEKEMCRERGLHFDGWREDGVSVRGTCNDGNAFYYWHGASGHAGVFATADALTRLCQFYMNTAKPAFVRAMEETVCGRGLAFDKRDVFPEGCGHSGFTGTSIYFSRAHDIGAVLLTNRLCRTSQEPANMQDVRRALHYALLDREPPQVV